MVNAIIDRLTARKRHVFKLHTYLYNVCFYVNGKDLVSSAGTN